MNQGNACVLFTSLRSDSLRNVRVTKHSTHAEQIFEINLQDNRLIGKNIESLMPNVVAQLHHTFI